GVVGDHYLIAPIVLLPGYAISLSTEQLVAILLIALLTFSNTRGLRVGKIVQNSFTFTKTAALIGVIVIGLVFGWKANCAALASHWWDASANGWSAQAAQPGFAIIGGLAVALLFGKAMIGPLFAQTAWTNVTFIGSEVREPGRNLSRALLYGCGIVVVLYLLANVAYIASLPLAEIQNAPQNRVAVVMMRAIFGTPGVLGMAAAIVLRKKNPTAVRPYRTWGYPIVPIISIALAAIVILDLAYLAPSTSGIGILIVLTGFPVYFLWRRKPG